MSLLVCECFQELEFLGHFGELNFDHKLILMLSFSFSIPLLLFIKSVLVLQDFFSIPISPFHFLSVVHSHMVVINSLNRCPFFTDLGSSWGIKSSFLHHPKLLPKLVINLSILIEVFLLSLHSLSFNLNLCRFFLLLYPTHLLFHQIELLYIIKFLDFVVVCYVDRRCQLDALALTFEGAAAFFLRGRCETCFLVAFVDRVIVNNSDCVLMEFTSLRFLDVVAKTVQLFVPFPIELITRLFLRRFAVILSYRSSWLRRY